MKILMTGASGFIGSVVLKKIQKYYPDAEITVLTGTENLFRDSKNVRTLSSCGYDFAEDYLTANKVSADIVIHLGAFIPKNGTEANDIIKTDSNIRNTEKLLRAIGLLPKIKRFIFISTIDVYSEVNGVITEETTTIPQTMYGWSKLYCEQMIKEYSKQKGFELQILRLGHVYGEGEENYKKAIPVMIKNAMENTDITIYGDGEAIRTFIYVDDVAEAVCNSLVSECFDVINVVGNEGISINDLASKIVELSNSKSNVVHIPTSALNRNLLFDDNKFMKYLLNNSTSMEIGLLHEIEYMRKL